MSRTLKDLLAQGAESAAAVAAPGRSALSHGGLRRLIDTTLQRLNALGLGRNDRVAIVLDNGPEMATCFMACASGVASAPLNPAYRADEFEFYLSDLNAKALIVEQGSSSPAVGVAELVSTISRYMTLYPGDLISTGTPPGVGMGHKPQPLFLKPGDKMTLGISGLGVQSQTVHAWDPGLIDN